MELEDLKLFRKVKRLSKKIIKKANKRSRKLEKAYIKCDILTLVEVFDNIGKGK